MTARIVVGVDGSDHGNRALEAAIEQARLRDGEIEAVIAYQTVPRFGWEAGLVMPTAAEQQGWARKALEEALATVSTDIPIKRTVVDGPAARALRPVGSYRSPA